MTQKELGYIELEWTCPHCGTVNPGMKRVCSTCGAPMAQDEKLQLPDQQELITDQQKLQEAKAGPSIQCPYCNVLNPAGTKLCTNCGGDLEAGVTRKAGEVLGAFNPATVPDKSCPSCGQPVKANAQRCPYCGGSLAQPEKSVGAPASPKKTPLWLILGGTALGVLCLVSVIVFVILSNRTNATAASVSDIRWQRSIEILEQQPAQHSDWSEDVPIEASNITCRDEFRQTSNELVPNSTEVCGTPYTIDVGSGAGKVVQDCQYQVYASYCDFTTLDLAVVNTAVAMGSDQNPVWPAVILQAGQQEGSRYETYQVMFDTGDRAYTYTPADLAEFSQYQPGSQWILDSNTFGGINAVRSK